MKVKLKIEPGRQEPEIVILAGEASEELDRLVDEADRRMYEEKRRRTARYQEYT